MKIVLIGGGEAGLHLLSWFSSDPTVEIPLVIEPDPHALIHRVEAMGFRWEKPDSGTTPPLIREAVDAIEEVVDPDLVIVSVDDAELITQVIRKVPPSVTVLTVHDLSLADGVRKAISEPNPTDADEIGVSLQRLEEFLDRFLDGVAWPKLVGRMTWFLQLLSGACGGAIFVRRGWGHQFLLEAVRGMDQWGSGELTLVRGLGQQAIEEQRTIHLLSGGRTTHWGELLAFPLMLDDRPVGSVVLAMPPETTGLEERSVFVLSCVVIRVVSVLCRGLQMEWARESAVRDALRRCIKEVIGREIPPREACQSGVEAIARQLSVSTCRLYCRGPRVSGWMTEPPAADLHHDRDPRFGAMMLTAVSLEPFLLVYGPVPSLEYRTSNGEGQTLYVPFSLGQQGEGVLVVEGHGMEQWSTQLIELLKEMGQLLGTVAQRVTEG